MKLRNKRTGDIWEFDEGFSMRASQETAERAGARGSVLTCFASSLTELNEEWEDYEEPKEYWYINASGDVSSICEDEENPEDTKVCIEIGNYFSSREEAEKAVRKLKAWKRLKDKGFKFVDFNRVNDCASLIRATFDESWSEIYDDLNTCFGGEE